MKTKNSEKNPIELPKKESEVPSPEIYKHPYKVTNCSRAKNFDMLFSKAYMWHIHCDLGVVSNPEIIKISPYKSSVRSPVESCGRLVQGGRRFGMRLLRLLMGRSRMVIEWHPCNKPEVPSKERDPVESAPAPHPESVVTPGTEEVC